MRSFGSIQDFGFWHHVGHDLFIGFFCLWAGWKLGKRQLRKEIAKGAVPVDDVLPPECVAVLLDDDE